MSMSVLIIQTNSHALHQRVKMTQVHFHVVTKNTAFIEISFVMDIHNVKMSQGSSMYSLAWGRAPN